MATIREIKRRIRSVRNIAQVTRALEAVSASKVRKAQAQVLATRPYAQQAWEVLTSLAQQAGAGESIHPLLADRPVKNVALIVVSGDRGLCGAYNVNIIRRVLEFVRDQRAPVQMITVGKKGRELLMRAGRKIVAEFSNLPAAPTSLEIAPISRIAVDDFLTGKVDEVYVAHTDFLNTIQQRPSIRRVLPLKVEEREQQVVSELTAGAQAGRLARREYLYEPSRLALLDSVIPRFIEMQVYQAVLESLASEHSARMVAMRNATDSAKTLVGELTLTYNKARQQSITSELLDIAGGAEALKQVLSRAA
ncbi:MAG TPA: ATP synthase F1 subunit gamma [Anaerolineae bacterium]|nr:ATP synthase F1 subunit gamma [Anaerolineae bacterium]